MRLTLVIGLPIAIAAACGSWSPFNDGELRLVGPQGSMVVSLADPEDLVGRATGTFIDEGAGWKEGLRLVREDQLLVHWSGSCSEEAEIQIEHTDGDRLEVTLSSSDGPGRTTCRPRGFVHHSVALELRRAFEPEDLTMVDERVSR